ncbi:DUF4269 domain-containing protein [Fulvivirgaceae bacterium PWU5]|uniref:DUF4269 domain-containing protein n=1 Tax=Dawidia cretensis TaxID=2782350 RepID=A0AAP2DXJ3_9BACT|nr:DUF4269 domain-containing protein [Dawidia cretensis]MBT1709460.1 DUF4269 domain-containing protein [Dawidia cretensis]
MIDFRTIDYLRHGTTRQQAVYTLLSGPAIFPPLRAYTPVLAGTIPINVDLPSSDLDILCCFDDAASFYYDVEKTFVGFDEFALRRMRLRGEDTVVANFTTAGFAIEVFGQHIPVTQQTGYRHMVIEHVILQEKGEAFRQQVLSLKHEGYKTEPAFAKLLALAGDPYQALLDFGTAIV